MAAMQADLLGYDGETIVLTGGSSGAGEAAARILGDLGDRVHIVDVQPPHLRDTLSSIKVDLTGTRHFIETLISLLRIDGGQRQRGRAA